MNQINFKDPKQLPIFQKVQEIESYHSKDLGLLGLIIFSSKIYRRKQTYFTEIKNMLKHRLKILQHTSQQNI